MDTYILHVSPLGDDSAEGTNEKPLQTLKRALELVQEQSGSRDVNIHLTAGRHYIAESLHIGRDILGGRRLRLDGAGMSQTVLCGLMPLQCTWNTWNGKVLVARLGAGRRIEALYINGEKQILARYPNFQSGVALGGYAQDALSPDRTSRWKHPQGGRVRALHHSEWGGNSYRITGRKPDGDLQLEWVGDNNRGNQMHSTKRMVENIFEELDSEGEWFYEKDEGLLYFWPPDGVDISTAQVEAAVTHCLFHISGESCEHPVSGLSLSGFTAAHTAETLFTGVYERPLRGDWGIVRGGAIFAENAEDIEIRDVCFRDIGGNAVVFSGYNKNHRLHGCDFKHIGATGVLAAGLVSAMRDASCYDGGNHRTVIRDFVPGPATEDYPRGLCVDSCWFYDIGYAEYQTAAVCLCVSRGITVRRCTVHHCTRAGININNGGFGGHLVEDNELFDCVTQTADHGPLNAWGRDRYWSVPQHDAMGYYGREKRPFALLDAVDTTVIRHNRISANHAFGIDIDDGASNYDICNNLCIGVGIKLRDGFDRRVHNNILVGAGLELHMSFAQNNDLIYTNIICHHTAVNELCINDGATTLFNNNIYWSFGKDGGGVDNLPAGDFHSEIVDPMFSDLEGNDFSLLPESPALRKGFVPFALGDAAFGRADAPKLPRYKHIAPKAGVKRVKYHDLVLSDIDGEGMRSAAGLPDYQGAFVLKRDVLGLFCKLGLSIGAGDVIRSIGGQNVENVDTFVRLFEHVPLKTPVEIVIYRSQQPMYLVLIKETEHYTAIADEAKSAWQSGAPAFDK